MARMRNWDPRTYAEVFVRLQDYNQPVSLVSRATGRTLIQVAYFKSFLDSNPTALPQNRSFVSTEVFTSVREELEKTIQNEEQQKQERQVQREQKRTGEEQAREQRRLEREALKRQKSLSEDEKQALSDEVVGCADLCRQAAQQFRMSTRRFIHLVLTHPRSL